MQNYQNTFDVKGLVPVATREIVDAIEPRRNLISTNMFNPYLRDFSGWKAYITCGAAGSRTRVQTSNACSVLHAQSTIDFRPGADRGRPTPDLAL